jgi:large subunit ribosomal protein L30
MNEEASTAIDPEIGLADGAAAKSTVKIKLVRSVAGTRESHRATVRGLGLRKLGSESELEDTPSVRGMINKVRYLVKVL